MQQQWFVMVTTRLATGEVRSSRRMVHGSEAAVRDRLESYVATTPGAAARISRDGTAWEEVRPRMVTIGRRRP